MISYEKFHEYMNKRKKIQEEMESLNNALEKMSPDFGGFYWEDMINLLDDVFKELLNDKYDELGWYIYEKNWGENKEMKMWDSKNNILPTDTLKDIYDIIVEDNKE